jgi:hypothetical protein
VAESVGAFQEASGERTVNAATGKKRTALRSMESQEASPEKLFSSHLIGTLLQQGGSKASLELEPFQRWVAEAVETAQQINCDVRVTSLKRGANEIGNYIANCVRC